MCTGATVANLKHTHKSTSACCFRLAKIHEHLREIEWNRSWSFTNRTHTVRSGKGQKAFESKSFRITVISMFHPFWPTLWHHCATQITPGVTLTHLPSPVSPFARSSAPENWCRFLPRSQNWNVGMEPRNETFSHRRSEGMTVAREDWASSQECNTD